MPGGVSLAGPMKQGQVHRNITWFFYERDHLILIWQEFKSDWHHKLI
jgi:hypothetical protein